ncbi:transposase [Roseovarius sp. MBR-78]|jgi:transposase|uniref:hypothetical protein n=1 Tax=Roseovarius sp. MBR-78 TaxID=3156460 RepID=UPI00339B6ED2
MAKMTKHTIGVDISKFHLDVFRLEDDEAQRFENSAAGFRSLKKWLSTAAAARIVFEPMWPYHKAYGTRAKTDAVDAQMLARMGTAVNLEHQAPCSKETLFSGIYTLPVPG